jgi:RecA-family ATPase
MKNIINKELLQKIAEDNQLSEAQINSINASKKLNIKQTVDLTDTRVKTIKEIEADLICSKFLPLRRNFLNNICAKGGVGKTTIALEVAIISILEEKHNYNRSFNVLFWASEDSESDIRDRFNIICNDILKLSKEDREYVLKNLTIIDIETDIPTFLERDFGKGKIKRTEDYNSFIEFIEPFDFIILDPLLAFYSVCGLDENNNAEAKQFMMLFTSLSQKLKKTFLMIAHTAKHEEGIRGASAFRDAFRLSYSISKYQTKILDEDKKEVKDQNGNCVMKDNALLSHLREVKIIKDNSSVELYLRASKKFFIFVYEDCYSIFRVQIFKNKSKHELDKEIEISNNCYLTHTQKIKNKKEL